MTYRAVYVAPHGEELVMAESAPTAAAAVEAAVEEARRQDVIGEYPRVSEAAFVAALRIDRVLWCPYCAETFFFTATELDRLVGPSASDPVEWTPQAVADLLAEHRDHRCWE